MITENITFLKQMITEKRDLYSILSFLSESIDILRTNLVDFQASDLKVYTQLELLLHNLDSLDKTIDSYERH